MDWLNYLVDGAVVEKEIPEDVWNDIEWKCYWNSHVEKPRANCIKLVQNAENKTKQDLGSQSLTPRNGQGSTRRAPKEESLCVTEVKEKVSF